MSDRDGQRELFGHPIALYLLFFTEAWERFSYYGMRAILILYLTIYLKMSDKVAGGIYGDYTGLVYLTPLLGGYLSDRFLGLQRAILIGAATMAVGQFCLMAHAWPGPGGGEAAAGSLGLLYLGLVLMILGNGFFKPNITTIVGKLYAKGDIRREAAFTIFYMGINVGALSPFLVSYLAEKVSWHYGFMSCGIGMTLGFFTFLFWRGLLGPRGRVPEGSSSATSAAVAEAPLTGGQKLALAVAALPGLLCAAWFALRPGIENPSLIDSLRATLWPVIFSICVCMYVLLKIRCTREEMKKINVVFILLIFVLFFWAAFEQAGSSLNLFAERYTRLSYFGYEFPAGWFQTVNSIFIILLAPIFSWLWLRLGRAGRDPSAPAKMGIGILLNAASYVVMIIPMIGLAEGQRVSPNWLVILYFLQTCGELCLSPVGLSMVTKLAPVRFGAMIMGVWFLANAWGNKLAGVGAQHLESLGPSQLFKLVAAILAGAGLVLVFFVPYLRRQMGDVH
ncbi:MAG TPA: peptide MFS transporter [Candidatus Polarisedimenticolaceae bacterium]|nr:peptide MFS transporter [Candidatus Polarisedimenticolaceae bacterium]